MKEVKSFPYPLNRKVFDRTYSHDDVLEIVSLAHDYFSQARDSQGRELYLQFQLDRLTAENEFLIRWVNSRIQDQFNED